MESVLLLVLGAALALGANLVHERWKSRRSASQWGAHLADQLLRLRGDLTFPILLHTPLAEEDDATKCVTWYFEIPSKVSARTWQLVETAGSELPPGVIGHLERVETHLTRAVAAQDTARRRIQKFSNSEAPGPIYVPEEDRRVASSLLDEVVENLRTAAEEVTEVVIALGYRDEALGVLGEAKKSWPLGRQQRLGIFANGGDVDRAK